MKKFLFHALNHVEKLFPSIYDTRPTRGSYHFCLAYLRSRLICVGLNKPDKVDSKAFYFARKFNLESKRNFPFRHSEEDLIGRLVGLNKLDSSLNIVSLRINRFGKFQMSKPCKNCEVILAGYGLTKIWYSNQHGQIVDYRSGDIFNAKRKNYEIF